MLEDQTLGGSPPPRDWRGRILITRLSHIGDCILTLPVLNGLRDHFPQAFIAWVVERAGAPLIAGHASLDELIVLERGWLKSPRRVWDIRRSLRRRAFDVTIDPQGLTKSAVLGWLSGANVRIGFARPTGRELSHWFNNRLVERTQMHMVSRGLELLAPLGVDRPRVRFDIAIDGAARASVRSYLNRSLSSHRFAVLNPGAGWDSRLWPTERFAAVARHLAERHSLANIVTWAGDREKQWAQQIVDLAGRCASLAPPTTLMELAALLEQASLFVGSDTGPLHLAAAVGARCVSLHGTTRKEQSGPYGHGHVALQEVYVDGGCRQRRAADNAAMKAIHVDQVCSACDAALAAAGADHLDALLGAKATGASANRRAA
jgi:lipopolysaccharide heptosyltransferase I